MNITLIEPFFTGSHAAWATAYAQYSEHKIDILSLSGNYWKWRMHGGAVTLATKFLESNAIPDLLLVTDMLDLTTFLALTRHKTSALPVAIYFHENQICYPWLPTDRDILHAVVAAQGPEISGNLLREVTPYFWHEWLLPFPTRCNRGIVSESGVIRRKRLCNDTVS